MPTPAILVTFASDAQLQQIKRCARAAGMTDRAFCRHMIMSGVNAGNPVNMILSAEEKDAVAALVGMGMPETTAAARVAGVTKKHPDLNADQIVMHTFKEKK